MSLRYEVLHNGSRVCVAGLDEDGVLSVGISYVEHQGREGDLQFHVGGLGRYDGSTDAQCHARWPTPPLGVGDQITIRVLPPGEFDEPVGMTASPRATRDDPDFGAMNLYVGAWLADVPFPFPPIESARVRIRAGKSGPTDRQRERYRELVGRFPSLWPEIAASLVRCHREIEAVEVLARRIERRVGIELEDGDSDAIGLSFRCADDPDDRGYFITLRNWQVVEVSAAD